MNHPERRDPAEWLWESKDTLEQIRFFPTTLGPMRSLTMRRITLKNQLEGLGYRVIEIHPGGAQDVWGIAREQRGLRLQNR